MSTPEPAPLLPEASLKQLWEEIAKRHDYAILATVKNASTPTEEVQIFSLGGPFPAIGLARTVQTELQKKVLEAGQIKRPEGT